MPHGKDMWTLRYAHCNIHPELRNTYGRKFICGTVLVGCKDVYISLLEKAQNYVVNLKTSQELSRRDIISSSASVSFCFTARGNLLSVTALVELVIQTLQAATLIN